MKTLFKLAYQLIFRGKWAVKIITVLLSAFSFALFALASMGYTYSFRDLSYRAAIYYFQHNSHLYFKNSNRSEDGGILNQEEVSLIEQKVGLDFISLCGNQVDISKYVYQYFFQGEMLDEKGNETPEYKEYIEWIRNHYTYNNLGVLVGSAETYTAEGFELVAGQYPALENEIALSVELYNIFQEGGYSYNFNNFKERLELGEFTYDTNSKPNTREEITCYSDLIGKKLVSWENSLPYMDANFHEEAPEEVVIVGIVDTSAAEWDYTGSDSLMFPLARFRSQAWRQKQISQNQLYTEMMFVPTPVSDKAVRAAVDVSEELRQGAQRRYEEMGISDDPSIGLGNYLESSSRRTLGINNFVMLLCGMGVFFLIFAVILNAHLMIDMMNKKQRQIGILRSVGANEKFITKIFLIGTLMFAAIIFIVALGISLGIFYGWLQAEMTFEEFNVCLFNFSGWTVLILAAVCFGVPVLSVLLPIKKFFRSSIVDNMKGISSKKKKNFS